MYKDSTPEASVIVPVYNAGQTLNECLVSIFNSTYQNFEVIIIDDCSNDRSAEIYSRFPCKVIKTSQRSGPGKTRNIGVLNSRGSILLFVDSDCVTRKDWITKMVGMLCNNSVAAVGGGYSFIAGTGNLKIERFAFLELKYRRKNIRHFIESLPACNLGCRKDAFLDTGGFPTQLKYPGSEDLEFSYNLSRKYKLQWYENNGVGHYFRTTVRGYLKQQFNYAKPLVSLYFRKPALILAKTHHKKNGYFSIIFLPIFLLGLMLSVFRINWLLLSLASILITPLNERGFLIFLIRKQGVIFTLWSLSVLYLRDSTWGWAVLKGIACLLMSVFSIKRLQNEDIISNTSV
jgi:glycosyltransferase involved in cell wall biosynthesis